MGSELEVVTGTVAQPRTPDDALREIILGRPPVRHWTQLGAWLADRGEAPGLIEATGTWIVSRRSGSEHTRHAYAADLSRWFTWCAARGCHPVTARNQEADLYAAACREAGLSPATAGRRLATVSSWYIYALRTGVATVNPVAGMERPRVSKDDSPTIGLSRSEADRLIAAADADGPRSSAIIRLLLTNGERVGVISSVQVTDLGHEQGHRVLARTIKGGAKVRDVLPPPTAGAIDAYLGSRGNPTEGPLFATRNGKPVDQPYVFRLVRRLARKAGIPSGDRLSPHSLRATAISEIIETTGDLALAQDFAHHADPRTTQLYNKRRHRLDRHASYILATRYGVRAGGEPEEAP